MRYGERFIHRWKGWLCSALATAGLLAVSAGTATAQVTVKGPADNKVTEGGIATYTVTVKGFVPATQDATTATVTMGKLAAGTPTTTATAGEVPDDISTNFGTSCTVNVPAGPATGDSSEFSGSCTIRVQTTHDADAENEILNIEAFSLAVAGGNSIYDAATGTTSIEVAKGDDAPPTSLTINDDETQRYELALKTASDALKEGAMVEASLTAKPAHVQGSMMLTLNISDPADNSLTVAAEDPGVESGAVTGQTVTIGVGGVTENTAEATITIDTKDNDGNRVEDTITLTAHSGRVGASTLVDSLPIPLADEHELPAVAMVVVDEDGKALDPQPTSVEEGTSLMVVVMPVDKDGKTINAGEKLAVALRSTGSADASDYALVGTVEIENAGDASDPVGLEIRSDEDVGMEMLVFDAAVSGVMTNGPGTRTSEGVLSLAITDTTAKKIEPKAQDDAYPAIEAAIADGAGEDGLNPGEMVTIDTDDLFTVAMGYSASYGVSVSGDAASASASGTTITINAMKAGRSEITVTGSASEAGSSFQASQTVSNIAEVKFPVDVVDKDLTLTWYVASGANAVQNLVEGQTYNVVVHANREITDAEGDVTVTFVRDRAASEADDNDYTVETVTLTAGNDQAHGELAVMDDDVSEGGTDAGGNVGEQLVLFGEADPDVPVNPDPDLPEGALTIWDTAVPALPVIATWLLGLGLLGGGARQLYRRRRQG